MGTCLNRSNRNPVVIPSLNQYAMRRKSQQLSIHYEEPYEQDFEFVSPFSFDHSLLMNGYMRELSLSFSFNIPLDIIQIISTFYPSYQIFAVGRQAGEFGIGIDRAELEFTKCHTLSACIHSHKDVYISNRRLMIVNHGDLCCVGNNYHFELGLGNQQPQTVSTVCKIKAKDLGLDEISFFSSGLSSQCSFAVDASTNKIVSWGRYDFLQLGTDKQIRDIYDSRISQPTELIFDFQSTVVQICCGENFTVFRCANGCLYRCGKGLGTKSATPVLIEFDDNERIVELDCGAHHVLCIDSHLHVHGFGAINYGYQERESIDYPRKIEFFKDVNIKKVCCGYGHSAVIDQFGFVYLFGKNRHGQIGNNRQPLTEPYKLEMWADNDIESKEEFIKADDVSLGDAHTLILTCDNEVFSFGNNKDKQCAPYCEDESIDVPYWLQRDEIGISDSCVIARVIAGVNTTFIMANL